MSAYAEPYDFNDAVAAARRAAEAQKAAEEARRDASKKLAEAERAYRQSLAAEIVRQHADGAAWTVAQDLARGAKDVAELRYLRDVAKGVLDAEETRSWRHQADRRDTHAFIEWSKVVAPLGQGAEPALLERPIGSRRAA